MTLPVAAQAGMGSLFKAMAATVPPLRVDPDEWTRKMMRWHFSPSTGSPFWLAQRERLAFDPIADVTDVGSLRLFGLFDKAQLHGIHVRDLLPRGFSNRPFRIVETGGTTGAPIRVVDVTRAGHDTGMYRTMLRARGLEGLDALAMTPSGPHAYGHFVARLVDSWAGAAYFIDFDPRWVKRQVRRHGHANDYVAHLGEQTIDLLQTQRPGLLFTTSRLLLSLVSVLPRSLAEYGVRAVCTGGTSCSAEEARYARTEHLQGVTWIDTYGNTLMGHALQADPVAADQPYGYYLPPPLAFIQVVNPADPWREVARGERGRIMVNTLLEDLFIPNLLERDSALRVGPHPWFGWDGVAMVGAYEDEIDDVTEGVY